MRNFRTGTVGLMLGTTLLACTPAFAKGGSLSVGRGVAVPHSGGRPGFHGHPGFGSHGAGLFVGRDHHRFNRDRRPGSGHRNHWRRGWSGVSGWGYGGWSYGGWGYGGWVEPYAYSIPEADYFGYFTTGGGVTLEEGQPVYHYDRGYPYEWYNEGGSARQAGAQASGYEASQFRCETQWVPEGHRDDRVPVRICRR